MRAVPGKHRESTDPIREGFLEYAAGAVARRVPGRGNYISDGGWEVGQGIWNGVAGWEVGESGLFRLVTDWVIWTFILGAHREPCVGLRSSQ